jgi:hypothetical protein
MDMADYKVLSDKSLAILNALMSAIIPRGGPFSLGAADLNLALRVDDIVASLGSPAGKFFPLMLYYIQYSAFLKTGHLFTSLSPVKAGELLAGMEKSPFLYRRQLMLVLKTLTLMVFFERDEIADLIGYEHGCHMAAPAMEGKAT